MVRGVLMFITVPASIGIMALAQPLFTVFYGYDPIVLGHDPNHASWNSYKH
jgi:O-antigen/teichoic acid export membrane protein